MEETNNPMPFTKLQLKRLRNKLITPQVSLEFNNFSDEPSDKIKKLFDKVAIPFNDTTYMSIEQLDFPIQSLDHLYEQILEKNRIIGKHDEESE